MNEKRLREHYFQTFNGPMGRRVLAHMLVELHFFDQTVTEEESILRNYAVRLLDNIGVLQDFNIDRFVDSILLFPTEKVEEEEPGEDNG